MSSEAYLAALGAMHDRPKDLLKRAQLEADEYDGVGVSHLGLRAYLDLAGPNDPLRQSLGLKLARWDAEPAPPWSFNDGSLTEPTSLERRQVIYRLLGFDDRLGSWFTKNYPPHDEGTIVISADDWEPWYTASRRNGRAYWEAYERHLRDVKKWPASSVQTLDIVSDEIVERLADPTRDEAFQSKGLVVGYVQSGKTANFTGVIAKAIDAGYRYIIVMTGMIDLLREQTQRRIDMELVGVENLLGDGTLEEVTADPKFDYGDDEDWPTRFMRLGFDPDTAQQPTITRFTGKKVDYRGLGGAADQLKPVKHRTDLPLYAPENLRRARAGIFVIKKNDKVIDKLVKDLTRIKKSIVEIPVLIIDDESDQASPNTTNPARVGELKKDGKKVATRSSINQGITNLLSLMPRAQYIGYTATPFANVFINTSDDQSLFPKDFVIGLPRPFNYMGAADFSDVGLSLTEDEQKDKSVSNVAAYVRNLSSEPSKRVPELQSALDAFVLTGAVKLHRERQDPTLSFRHHTMLIHEAVQMIKHRDVLKDVQDLWQQSSYNTSECLSRLQNLYEKDLVQVSAARRELGVPQLPKFNDLWPYIGAAVQRIEEQQGNPAIVVNGDRDLQAQQQQLDFDRNAVWRVLIGGAKLSRGFTIEGLTISYFRRTTVLNDTLTQAGRWFGFRAGYRDLVRVFIGRDERFGKRQVDLLKAFDAVVQDEEDFRSQLRTYARPVGGEPQIRPIEIVPLVTQHLPWLRPTAANKMYNAVLEQQNDIEYGLNGYPVERFDLAHNLSLWQPILDTLGPVRRLPQRENSTYDARCTFADFSTVLNLIEGHKWIPNYKERAVMPRMQFLKTLKKGLTGFVIVCPQLAGEAAAETVGAAGTLTVQLRGSRPSGLLNEPTDPKHRRPAEIIANNEPDTSGLLTDLVGMSRGVLLAYPIRRAEADVNRPKEPLIIGFRVFLPRSLVPPNSPLVRFRVQDPTAGPIVSSPTGL